jgi:4-hydroxy-tetrahydrodipicolinate reductase
VDNALACLGAGVHVVIGTTGFDPAPLRGAHGANVLIAPNFAIGAVLMMRFAAEASRHMAKAEIVELHHDRKVDAPSGTAARTAELMGGDGADPLRAPAGPGRPPGGDPGGRRADAHDPPRLDGPHLVHARRAARRPPGGSLPQSPVIGLEHLL